MIELVLLLAAIALIVWWLPFTIRTFATIARNLFCVAVEIGYMWRVLTRPRGVRERHHLLAGFPAHLLMYAFYHMQG